MAKLTPQAALAGESQQGYGPTAPAADPSLSGRPSPITNNSHPLTPSATSALIHSDGRPADVVAFEQAVVGFFVDAADLLGVPKSVAAIYGICFASAEPLGFSEINERLEISSGSISQGLKVLRDVGALKVCEGSQGLVVSGPLSVVQRAARQRERYEPDMELRKLALHFIEERLEKQLTAGKGRLTAIHAAIPKGDNGAARELKARIKALQSWNSKGRSLSRRY